MNAKLWAILALVLCSSASMFPMANAFRQIWSRRISLEGATLSDVVRCASQYGLKPSDPKYNATICELYDVDYDGGKCPDGPINMIDLVMLISNYTGK